MKNCITLKMMLWLVSYVCLTSHIWSGNAKEDYIIVVAHYVISDWEYVAHYVKSVIGFKLIEVSHNGINIAECIWHA
jgi:hypothetical protein